MNEEFARNELAAGGESVQRAERQGPFVAALIELAGGGYIIRVGQPAVVSGRRSSRLPDVVQIGPWGQKNYAAAARRFNQLLDEDLT